MKLIVRLLAMMVVVPATYYFIYWVPFSFFPVRNALSNARWIPSIVSLLCAVGVGWYIWKKLGSGPEGLISSALVGAGLLGGIGFCVGFFGPIIFIPYANQGPLLGIFITGPLGFLLGAASGVVYCLVKGRKSTRE